MARKYLAIACSFSLPEYCYQIFSELIKLDANNDDDNGSYYPRGASAIHDSVLGLNNMALEACITTQPASINSLDDLGYTALHWATMTSNLAALRVLVELGADLNCRGQHIGETPLHLACQYDLYESCSFLLDAGALVNAQDDNGYTPLYQCQIGSGVRRLILKRGADPNMRTKLGDTALHDTYGDLELYHDTEVEEVTNEIKALVEAGADLQARGRRGCKPLFCAAESKQGTRTIPLLLELGAASDQTCTEGQCILHELARYGRVLELGDLPVSLLAGLNPDLPDHSDCTPLDWMKSRITGYGPLGYEEEPTLGELFVFTKLVCETRELYWKTASTTGTEEELETKEGHVRMTNWLGKLRERFDRDETARDIICYSLDMWYGGDEKYDDEGGDSSENDSWTDEQGTDSEETEEEQGDDATEGDEAEEDEFFDAVSE